MHCNAIKENKRIWIIDQEGNKIYTPPDFLRNKINKKIMTDVATKMSLTPRENWFNIIFEFEGEM